jgi:hypothetical protein
MVTISDHFPMARWERMEDFISTSYRADHALCSRRFFSWLFRVNETNNSAPVMCAWDGEELVAILGCLDLRLRWGGRQADFPALGLTHWMSSKRAPLGVGWVLARQALGRHPLAVTLNASRYGAPFFRSLGWHFRERIPRYLCVFDQSGCAQISSPEGRALLGQLRFRSPRTGRQPRWGSLENYAPEWERYPQMAFGIKRSKEYLQWRYVEHPVFSYQLSVAGDHRCPAVCVYRLETAYGCKEMVVGRILEFYYPDDPEGREEGILLMGWVLEQLQARGCGFVEFYCTSQVYGQTIIDLGGGMEPAELYVLPTRLTPIQAQRHDLNLAFAAPRDLPVPAESELYFTRADVDGDQPVTVDQGNVAAH